MENWNDLSFKYLLKLAHLQPDFLIDFNKFVEIIHGEIGSLAPSAPQRKHELHKIFQLYDEGRGKIGASQLTKILQRLGEPYNITKATEWLKSSGTSPQCELSE